MVRTGGRRRRGQMVWVGWIAALGIAAAPVRAEWPLIWDFEGRSDEPVGAAMGPGGDLWVLSSSHRPGQGTPSSVVLRVDGEGAIVWSTPAPEPGIAHAMALAPSGQALVLERTFDSVRLIAFSASGSFEWSRTRQGVSPDFPFRPPRSAPIWDAAAGTSGAWRVPSGVGNDFLVLSFEADGDALPDITWTPPAGAGHVTSMLPRSGGGLVIAGIVENVAPPGWWTVAVDAKGEELWHHFEGEEVRAGAFSGAILLSADPVRVWADDETGCGVFSLQLWSIDLATGEEMWSEVWPPRGGAEPCAFFLPAQAVLRDGRILVTGQAKVPSLGANFDPAVLSYDAETGERLWERVLPGERNSIQEEIDSVGGNALAAFTLFPPVNPGPTPLRLAAWNREGVACGSPRTAIPSRVLATFAVPDEAAWLLVGYAFQAGGTTTEDLVLQKVSDPCAALFADGFESGDAAAWSLAEPGPLRATASSRAARE